MTEIFDHLLAIVRSCQPCREGGVRTGIIRRDIGARTTLGEHLESRVLRAIIGLSGSASPVILRQINPMNQPHAVQVALIRPVNVAGYVTDSTPTIPTVSLHVVDSNGKDMPSRQLTPQFVMTSTPGPPNTFFYATRIGLNRFRGPDDKLGRKYTIVVTAQDAENSRTIAIPVTTPPAAPHRTGPPA